MLNRLKKILNTYTDKELEDMELWINSNEYVDTIIIDDVNINLITSSAEIKVNDMIDKGSR